VAVIGAIVDLAADPSVIWLGGALALLLVAVMTPAAARGWRALGRTDEEVSLRKVHVGEVPRVGGLVVLVGFGAVMLLGLAGTTELSATHELFSVTPLTGVLVGALICGLCGLYDDLVGMRARWKLLLQVAAAAVAVGFGARWGALEGLLGPELLWATQGLTAVFLVAGVNAINLMDGLDGLAGGIVAQGFLVILLASVLHGSAALAVGWIAAAALGAVLGFLLHNRHPARVFLGDCGAYFLGFLLTALALFIEPVRERVAIVRLSIPLLVLALPLIDMGLAVLRRSLRGQPIFSGDCDHIHHRLLARGIAHGRVVWMLWATSAVFAGLAYLNVLGVGGWWTLTGALAATLGVAILLGYHNLLRRLPAFTGEGTVTIRDRRREMMTMLAAIDSLAALTGESGPARWRRLAPTLAPIVARLGVPGFEIRAGGEVIAREGEDTAAWGWLSLRLPGSEGAELRLALAARLPELQQSQLVLIERVVALLAGQAAGARQQAPERGAASGGG
jgi:UDP-GlcNAc:undecaprenyl-phosphate GlcNAc-1-phosphate transferase